MESAPSNTLSISYTNTISRTQGGSIGVNTVWTPGASNAPYLITSNLIINSGATLTILPGTVLQFSAGTYLSDYAPHISSYTPYGNLIVRGTSTSRVVFTSATHTKDAWNGISIGDGSSIDHADIQYASSGVTATGGTVSNSLLSNNSYGVTVKQGTPYIGSGNVITANTIGIFTQKQNFYATTPSSTPYPVVTGNQIYDNTEYNYSASNFNNASTVVLNAIGNWWGTTSVSDINSTILSYTNTKIQSCDANACYKTSPRINFGGYLDGPGGVPVNSAHFFYTIPADAALTPNTTYELINSVVVPQGVTLTVPEGVTFDSRSANSGLTVQGALVVEGTSTSPVIFTSTQTTGYNWGGITVSDSGTALINHAVFEYASAGVNFSGSVADAGDCLTQCVQNSQFTNNSYGMRLGNTATIRSNTFQNNVYGILLSGAASPIINGGNVLTANLYGIYAATNAGSSQPVINDNSIYDNTSYNYFALSPSSTVLNARNNWWGSASLETIASTIYDYKDYDRFPVVDFSGYLQSANGAPTVENNLVAITSDTTLLSNTTYRALSSLWIAPNVTLTVQPGAILQFPANTTLRVEGSLVVEEGASPAIFTSAAHITNSWKGIEVTATATKVMIAGAIIQYADKGVYFNAATQQDLACTVFCIKNSTLQYNNYGLYLTDAAMPMLTGNRIVNNAIAGIYLAGSRVDTTSPNPTITNNDIYGNKNDLYIYNYSPITNIHLNATGNWWGTASPTQSYDMYSSSNIVIGYSMPALSVVDYSNAATQSLFTAISLPTVSLTASGAPFNAPATVTLNATATVSNGAISVVDFYQGTTWLGNATSPVNNVYSFTWNNVATGSYTLTARAANTIGLTTTSSPATITILGNLPPTISLTAPTNGSELYAPAIVSLGATVNTTNSTRTITKVGFYNGAILLGESTVPPYSYAWSNVAAGAYSITAVATDNTGAITTSSPLALTVNPTTLRIDTPINNSIINDDHMLVTGTFIAPANTGVSVNGVLATLFKNSDGSYTYYANNVPLTLGNNTITARLVSQDGQTQTTSVTVTSTGSPGFKITADRVFDVQPNGVIEFEYQNTSGLAASSIQIDSNGDGTVDTTMPVSSNPLLFTMDFSNYSTVINWPVVFRVIDANSNVLYTTTQVIIMSTETQQDADIKPVITNLFSRISQGNTTAALNNFSGQAGTKYESLLSVLKPYAENIASELTNAEKMSTGNGDAATYTILRAENGVNKVYIVNMVKGSDGVWRIDSM